MNGPIRDGYVAGMAKGGPVRWGPSRAVIAAAVLNVIHSEKVIAGHAHVPVPSVASVATDRIPMGPAAMK